MSSRKTTIIAAGVVIIVLAVILITGRKSINVVNGVNGYSDETNDGQIYNVAFNVNTQNFDMACSKPGCT